MVSSRNDGRGRRVVITGTGLLSPAGNTLEDYWHGLTSGRSAIRRVTLFDVGDLPIDCAGEVDDGMIEAAAPPAMLKRLDRGVIFGVIAAGNALEDAGITEAVRNDVRVGCFVGSGMGPCHAVEASYDAYNNRGWRAVRPTSIPRCMFNVMSSEVSIRHHLTGTQHVVAAACASSTFAMTEAFEAIRTGREDVAVAGGADAPLVRSMFSAWIQLRVLAHHSDPARASRPFDRRRNGFVIGEGSGMLVFEELEHARARGAKIYAEIIGHGAASDATHITKPDVTGQASAIRRALDFAGIRPADVDYINAHGTGTLLNDLTETQAIKQVFGKQAWHVPISSTKSVIGHTMGASGALELVASILAIKHQALPPTVNQEEPDPECDLDYVPNTSRPARVRVVLKNSFAFGGANCVLVIRAFEDDANGQAGNPQGP